MCLISLKLEESSRIERNLKLSKALRLVVFVLFKLGNKGACLYTRGKQAGAYQEQGDYLQPTALRKLTKRMITHSFVHFGMTY